MRHKGFTIVELVMVIIVLGILTATMLPRFLDATDEARRNHAQATAGAFTEAIISYRATWLASGKPQNLVIDGKTLSFNADGWPHPSTQNLVSCVDLWDTAFRSAEPIQAYVAGGIAEDWSVLPFGSTCLFVYQDGEIYSASNLLPFFWYRPVNGQVDVLKYNMG